MDDQSHTIWINSGTWVVNETVIIPAGYRVVFGEGTTLDMINASKIVSYSPVEMIGSESNPITITSSDFTGQGIVVLNANASSTISYAWFSNLSPPMQGMWHMTAPITFYGS